MFLALRWRRLPGLQTPVRALLPYGFLLALLTLSNGVWPIRGLLERLGPFFTGPGLSLLVSAAFAGILLDLRKETLGPAAWSTFRQWLPVAGTVVTFVLAGQVVATSGAAALLASGAEVFGDFYVAVAPMLGALGGALTGSNVASNALFMPLQVEAAQSL